jgi:GNAT superfamily N-acetyltransferase
MSPLNISLLQERDLPEAERLLKLAFGTFKRLQEPLDFGKGAKYSSRWYGEPLATFAAKQDGLLIGYVMLAHWGSFGRLGPIVTHPDHWNQGIASQLMRLALAEFEQWQVRQMGLCTYANSTKHLYFYGKFGYAPRFLIALFTKAISHTKQPLQGQRYSQLTAEQQAEFLEAAYQLTDWIYEGLDLGSEIKLVEKYSLGETIFLGDDAGLAGLAICHYGIKSEAPENSCYVKFAAAKSSEVFERLLDKCEMLTATVCLSSLVAGVDTACEDAYQRMLARKYRIQTLMLSMYKPNKLGYTRPDTYIIDDLR